VTDRSSTIVFLFKPSCGRGETRPYRIGDTASVVFGARVMGHHFGLIDSPSVDALQRLGGARSTFAYPWVAGRELLQ
jgi:hypothetical protein